MAPSITSTPVSRQTSLIPSRGIAKADTRNAPRAEPTRSRLYITDAVAAACGLFLNILSMLKAETNIIPVSTETAIINPAKITKTTHSVSLMELEYLIAG